ncbi:MAG: ribosome biogenesis GTPase Der [Deltaproteobacteria bacterium RBG_16_48_10]|nr:MAG: ribosome biogenesis GTPase Der [Deltaproteobacteria bacterium RBG_16_48_10]
MKPIVAIVGRPNVGKSTLFNRIAGGRKAIVFDEPGVTRDRNYADVEWVDTLFTLIDTGGFEPVSKDRIFAQMAEQCQLAMDEADVILFLMDGREGLTPSDKEIANLLRRQGKPVFYVVNKIDGPQREEKVYEFYGLGIDPIYSISAEQRYGVDELIDDVVKGLPKWAEEPRDEKATKVSVIGRPNVGKSSLINRLLGYKRVLVDEVPGTTRDAIDTPIERDGKRYILIDTAGIRRKSRISLKLEKYSIVEALRTIDRSDVVLLILDSIEGVTDQDARIGGVIQEKGKGCILVVNKWDLVEKDSKTLKEFEKKVYEDLKYLSYAPTLFISALTGQRIGKVLDLVDQVAEETRKRISTGSLNRYFGQWVERLQPPLYKNRRVKLNYITQVYVAPPTFLIYTNLPEGIHFSYQRYLINQLREAFLFEGVPIRLYFRKKRKER